LGQESEHERQCAFLSRPEEGQGGEVLPNVVAEPGLEVGRVHPCFAFFRAEQGPVLGWQVFLTERGGSADLNEEDLFVAVLVAAEQAVVLAVDGDGRPRLSSFPGLGTKKATPGGAAFSAFDDLLVVFLVRFGVADVQQTVHGKGVEPHGEASVLVGESRADAHPAGLLAIGPLYDGEYFLVFHGDHSFQDGSDVLGSLVRGMRPASLLAVRTGQFFSSFLLVGVGSFGGFRKGRGLAKSRSVFFLLKPQFRIEILAASRTGWCYLRVSRR